MSLRKLTLRSLLTLACAAPGVVPATAETSPATHLIRALTDRPTVTREDCARVTAVLVGNRDAGKSGPAAWRTLRERGVVRAAQEATPLARASRGYASLLFARALGERQSIFRSLMPFSERFAYKHLLSLGLVSAGGPGTPISGPELVSLLALARRRQATPPGKGAGS